MIDHLSLAADMICRECGEGDSPDYHDNWGWFHGAIGVEVRPCRAWKLYDRMARDEWPGAIEPLRANAIIRVAKALARTQVSAARVFRAAKRGTL